MVVRSCSTPEKAADSWSWQDCTGQRSSEECRRSGVGMVVEWLNWENMEEVGCCCSESLGSRWQGCSSVDFPVGGKSFDPVQVALHHNHFQGMFGAGIEGDEGDEDDVPLEPTCRGEPASCSSGRGTLHRRSWTLCICVCVLKASFAFCTNFLKSKSSFVEVKNNR